MRFSARRFNGFFHIHICYTPLSYTMVAHCYHSDFLQCATKLKLNKNKKKNIKFKLKFCKIKIENVNLKFYSEKKTSKQKQLQKFMKKY